MTTPQVLGPDGQPARREASTLCPQCQAPKDRRVRSSGFGAPHDVCGKCGYEFEEWTCR